MRRQKPAYSDSRGGDLTIGQPFSCLLRFSIPLLIGNFFQYLYTTVDAAVVGRFIGSHALAAVGTCSPIINLMVGLFIGLSMGSGIIISQKYGACDLAGVRKTIQTSIALTCYIGLVVTAAGLLLTHPLLRLLRVEDALIPLAAEYLRIIFGGILVSMLYNLSAAVLRALGDSRTPLNALLLASIINVLLDVALVAFWRIGVRGTAWATIFSQFVSVCFSTARLLQTGGFVRPGKELLIPSRTEARHILGLGFPSAVQQTAFSMGMLAVQGVINSLGVAAMATYVAVMKVDNICSLPITSFGLAMTTFTGQCIGAGNMARVEQGARQCMLLGVSVAAALSTLIYLFGRYPLMLFTADEVILTNGLRMLRILCPFYAALVIIDVRAGQLRGAGNTLIPMLNSSLALCIIRVPLLLLLIRLTSSETSIYWSTVVSCLFGAAFISFYYRFGRWRTRAMNRFFSKTMSK